MNNYDAYAQHDEQHIVGLYKYRSKQISCISKATHRLDRAGRLHRLFLFTTKNETETGLKSKVTMVMDYARISYLHNKTQ